jgi:hexulose-6-phosphate isomerase
MDWWIALGLLSGEFPMFASISRRKFLGATAASGLSLSILPGSSVAKANAVRRFALQDQPPGLKGRILKTLKQGMVQTSGKLLVDKFLTARAAGFDGIEMDSPGMDVEATRAAIAASQLPVDGTVCSTHWQIRHTSPDPAQREQALADLETALRDTHAVGGHTVLLVVGHGQDGPENEIWPRAVDNIAKAIPLAAKLGVVIAIENVWNHFLYDHEGDSNQTADTFLRFVDEFQSPWVGMQFDIGNHWKYGSAGDWIRTLGRRVVKLDVKGFSRAQNQFTPIGADDIDWPDVCRALREIGFTGWAAAEVDGGDEAALREISAQMSKVLELT